MFEIHINTLGTKVPFNFRTTKFSFVITFTFNVRLANIITARKQSLRRLCFYTCLSVILFTGWDAHPCPQNKRQAPPPPPGPEAGTPQTRGRHPPPEQCMLGDTENKPAVRILLECILVTSFFAGYLVNELHRFS